MESKDLGTERMKNIMASKRTEPLGNSEEDKEGSEAVMEAEAEDEEVLEEPLFVEVKQEPDSEFNEPSNDEDFKLSDNPELEELYGKSSLVLHREDKETTQTEPRNEDIVTKESSSSNYLRRHRTKPFCCATCGKCFTGIVQLENHVRVHTGEKPFKCTLCDHSCAQKSSLVLHMRVHSDEKPFVCIICSSGFKYKNVLVEHMRVHSGERPFKCTMCEKSFPCRRSLKDHLHTHTGEKPFVCQECGRGFSDRSSLRRHLNTHTGEKPYVCQECGKRFTRSASLSKHKCGERVAT